MQTGAMGTRGRARDLQPPSLIDGGNLWQTKFTVCRLWAPRGRARGTCSPVGWLLEACSPPCRRKFQFLLEEFCQNDVRKLHFLAISAPGRKTVGSCGSSYPSVRRFLGHPCLKVDLSQTFQEVFTAQVMEISHKAVECIVS